MTGSFTLTNNNVSIGCRLGGGSSDDCYDGLIDEMAIWNRTVSASEVSQIYNNGAGIVFNANPPSAPEFTVIPANASIPFGTGLSVTFAAINTSENSQVDSFTVDNPLFTMNPATGVLTNATVLAGGNFTMIVSVNETLGGLTTSVAYSVIVTQGTGTCDPINFSPASTVGNLDAVNVTGSCNTGVLNLTRDGVDVLATLGTIVNLPGPNTFVYIITGITNANLTGGTATANLTVLAGPGPVQQICDGTTASFIASVGLSGIVLLIILAGGIIFFLFLVLRGGGTSGMGELFSTQNIIGAVVTILVLFVVVALGAFILGDSLCQAIVT